MARLTRRDVLRGLLATPIATTLDLERLLWVPRTFIVVPSSLSIDEINRITIRTIMPAVVDSFFRTDPFLAYLRGAD